MPMSAEPVSARLFEADTDIPIITNDGEEEIGEFSTTTQRAGLPFDAWVWIGPKYPKFSSDGIRVVARSGDNDPQTYVIRFKERNEHVTWHKLPRLYVQRPSGECVYGPYRMTPQHREFRILFPIVLNLLTETIEQLATTPRSTESSKDIFYMIRSISGVSSSQESSSSRRCRRQEARKPQLTDEIASCMSLPIHARCISGRR